jgi:hypothetical protein
MTSWNPGTDWHCLKCRTRNYEPYGSGGDVAVACGRCGQAHLLKRILGVLMSLHEA